MFLTYFRSYCTSHAIEVGSIHNKSETFPCCLYMSKVIVYIIIQCEIKYRISEVGGGSGGWGGG